MAKQLNVNLAFTADTSQAAQQVRNLQQQLTGLINTPVGVGQKLTDDLVKATSAAADLKVHLQNATNVKTGTLDFGKLNQSLQASGQTLSQYAVKLQSLGPAGQQAFMTLARSVANAEIPIRRTSALLTSMKTTLANTARWQISSSILHGFVGTLSKAWNYSKDLNTSLNNIRIVTGKSVDEMARFAGSANKAAKALSTSTTAYTDAALIYYQQGIKDDAEIAQRVETTTKLANVSRQSAEVVSDQMTAIWNNFDDGTKSLEYYADVVTALGAATASSSEEIATGLEKFAAVAETVGLSYEYATAALATVTATTRQSADVVGTAFKTLFARIQDLDLGKTLDDGTTLGKYSQALSAVGINIKDNAGNLKDMDDILDEMGSKWNTISKDQQVALAQTVAGVRQYTQLIALMDNWNYMKENVNEARNSAGTLQEQQKIYEESWAAASKRVRTSLESIYASIMKDDFFIELTDGFAKLIDKVGSFVQSIGGLQGVLSGLGYVLIKIYSKELTKGFENLAYRIKMSTQAGREAVQQAKDTAMNNFAKQAVNYDTATNEGLTMNKVYQEEILMQQQLAANANQLTEEETKKAQILLEQKRIMGDQSIELAKQLDKIKEISSSNKISLMGQGLKNGVSMDAITEGFKGADIKAKTMGNIDLQLSRMSKAASIADADINKLKARLQSLDAIDDKTLDGLISDLREAAASGKGLDVAMANIQAQMKKSAMVTSEQVAAMLGIKQGTPEYEKLKNKIEEYIAKVREAKVVQDQHSISLQNGKKSAAEFANVISGAGQKAQSMSQMLTSAMSGLMSAGMLISSFKGLIDTIQDPDTSGWEKFGKILTSVSMVAMSLIGTFNLIKVSIGILKTLTAKETVAKVANALATIGQAKAEERLNRAKGKDSKLTRRNIKDTWTDTATKTKTGIRGRIDTFKNAWNQRALEKNSNFTKTKSGSYAVKGHKGFISADKAGSMAGKQAAQGLVMKGVQFAAGAAAIATVALTIKAATDQYNKHNKAAKEAAEHAKQAATAFNAVQQAYSNFTTDVDAYNEAQKQLSNLTKGTAEYEEQVLKANEATMKLINSYEGLTYTIDEDGLIVIDQESLLEAKKVQREALENAQRASLMATQRAKDKKIEAEAVDFKRDKLKSQGEFGQDVGNTVVAGGAGAAAGALGALALSGPVGWAAAIAGGIGLAIGGIVSAITGNQTQTEDEALKKLSFAYAKEGNSRFADEESFRELLADLEITDPKLIESLVQNRDATRDLAKQMAEANEQKNNVQGAEVYKQYEQQLLNQGLSKEDARIVANMAGTGIDEITEEIYNNEYKDMFGGMTDADIQKAYAEMMGYGSSENMDDNKAKYYNKDGSEIGVIDDEVARRALANKAAYDKLGPAIDATAKRFVELQKSTNNYDKAMVKFLKNQDFNTMSKTEYQDLKKQVGGEDGKVSDEEAVNYLNKQFGGGDGVLSNDEARAYGYESAQAFIDSFQSEFDQYEQRRTEVIGGFGDNIINLFSQVGIKLDEFSVNEIKAMGSHVQKAFGELGDEAGTYLADIYAAAGDEAGDLAIVLDSIDWSLATPEDLNQKLKDAGLSFTYTTETAQELIDIMSAGIVTSMDTIRERSKLLQEMSKKKQGDTIDKNQYDQLDAELQSYFTLMSDGTYKLTQDALAFYNAVQQKKKEVLDKGIEDRIYQIDKNIKLKNVNKEGVTAGFKGNYHYDYNDYIQKKFYGYDLDFRTGGGGLTIAGKDQYGGEVTYNPGQTTEVDGGASHAGTFMENWREAGEAPTVQYNVYRDLDEGSNEKGETAIHIQSYATGTEGDFVDSTVYAFTNANDYQKYQGDNTKASKEDYNNATTKLDFLEYTDWGKTEGKSAIAAWRKAIEDGTLTANSANAIANAVNEHIEEYEGILEGLNLSTSDLGYLIAERVSQEKTAEDRYAKYQEIKNSATSQEAKDAADAAYYKAAAEKMSAEANEGLDMEAVNEYGDYLIQTLELAEEQADEVARAIMKMNKGVETLSSNWEEWGSILKSLTSANKDVKRSSEEYMKAMQGTRKALSDILDVSEEFIDIDFVESADNLALIEKAAQGDAAAIDELGRKISRDIAEDAVNRLTVDDLIDVNALSIDDAKNKVKTLLDEINTLMQTEIPKIELGKSIDTGELFSKLQEVVKASKMTVEESNAYYRSMGFTPKFKTTPITADTMVTVTTKHHKRQYVHKDPATGEWDEWVDQESSTSSQEKAGENVVNAITMVTESGGKTVNVPSPEVESLTYTGGGSMNNSSSKNAGGKSSGGGGSSSKKKVADEAERYHEVKKSLENLSKEYNALSKARDRAFGKDKLAYLNKEIELIDQEIAKQKEYIAEIEKNFATDKSTLAGYGATFNEKGEINNYDELIAQYVEKFNNGQITEEEYNNFKDAISQYEETYALWLDESQNLVDKENERLDKKLEGIKIELELKTSLADDSLEYINYQLAKIEDSAYEAADALALLIQSANETSSKIQATTAAIQGLLSNHGITDMDAFFSNPDAWDDYNFTATEIDNLRKWRTELLNANKELMALKDQAIEQVIASFDAWNEKMTENISKFDHYSAILDSFQNIIDIVGKDTLGLADDAIAGLTEAKVKNANNKLEASRAKMEALQQAEAETRSRLANATTDTEQKALEKTLKHIQEQTDKAEEEMMSNWEEALQAAADAFEQTVDRVISSFEEAMAGTFGSLEDMQGAFDQATEISERYVADYKEIYELSKLNRDITNSIDETDNLKAKRALRDLQKEINDLQNSEVEMSQYDLDHLRAKYELRLAEIALEEAQNAKSQVRMRRDSEGNYSYVFTADQSKIDEAQQNYEDKLYEMQELNSEYIKEMQNNILQSEIELAKALRELDRTKFASDEEYYAKVNELTAYYTGQRNYYLDETNKGITNNQDLVNTDWANYSATTGYKMSADKDYVDSFAETTYAQIAGYESIEDAQNRFAAATKTMVNDLKNAFTTWQQNTESIMGAAGTSIEKFGEDMQEAVYGDGEDNKGIVGASDEAAETANRLKEAMAEAFSQNVLDGLSDFATNYENNIKPMIEANERLAESINGVIQKQAEMEANVPQSQKQPPAGDTNNNNNNNNQSQKKENPHGKASDAGSSNKSIQWALQDMGYDIGSAGVDGIIGSATKAAIRKFQSDMGIIVDGSVGSQTRNAFKEKGYLTGGLVDYTGHAWLDGTPARPEYVLNADQTAGFLKLISLLDGENKLNRLSRLQEEEMRIKELSARATAQSLDLVNNIAKIIDLNAGAQAYGLGQLTAATAHESAQVIEQEITIHAEFPTASERGEIEAAFDSLLLRASQFANRKKL